MTMEGLHPNHLKAGDTVGAWQIVQELGQGGTSRVFKVQRNGRFYTMKMALSPISEGEEARHEGDYRRLAREATALFTYASHPHLLRVYAVDFWPDPVRGYPFLVMEFVDGETWHAWRWRTHPDACALVDVFTDVVRAVGGLHSRGVYHRDLKAENLLIRREDGRAFIIDLGSARLPAAFTKTLGLPEGALHLAPPELLTYIRGETWKQGEPFRWGVAAELYTLGVLLYEGLTDHHPFNPELKDEELLAAIASVRPTPPHTLNPRAPRALSDIALTLLEKRPEDRYVDTEALLRALEQAGKERESPVWKVPLLEPGEKPAEPMSQVVEGQPPAVADVPREAPEVHHPKERAPVVARRERPPASRRARGYRVLLASLALLCLCLWLARSMLSPTQKESPAMPAPTPLQDSPPSGARPVWLAAWLCAAFSLGCPGAQVKPPESADCSQEALDAMFKELKIRTGSNLYAEVDISQPGRMSALGVYQEGPLIGRISRGDGELPVGTLLYGYLWTGPGIYDVSANTPEGKTWKREAVLGRYTQVVLPDGRKYPVCIVLGDRDGRVPKAEGSGPGVTTLPRALPVSVVRSWP
jgi:serine/threonine-protein kinase